MYRSSFLVIGSCHWDGWEGLIDMTWYEDDFTKREEFKGMPKCNYFPTNYLRIPKLQLKLSNKNIEMYNKQIDALKELELPLLERTPSGGIKKWSVFKGYDSRRIGRSGFELTVSTPWTSYRLIIKNNVDENDEALQLTGRQSFLIIKNEFEKDGIKLMDYSTMSGLYIKETEIEPPMIKVGPELQLDKVYEHVTHLDFHSSYPGGLANKHPEMRKTLERIYEKRKTSDNDAKLKLALDASIGFFQSEYCCKDGDKYALANLSRDAINDNNDRIRQVEMELLMAGKTPLLYNTDGIWYLGGPLENGRDYGKGIGKWENDHFDCTIRVKSKGAYEYIENGKYQPVLRGTTQLDQTKPRNKWVWGDIYKCGGSYTYNLDEKSGKIIQKLED